MLTCRPHLGASFLHSDLAVPVQAVGPVEVPWPEYDAADPAETERLLADERTRCHWTNVRPRSLAERSGS
ncbi:hypothetical protein ACH4RA_18340 [Streptomyces smyrnaeus]|uniref:hypothetical protein n=1 Tax=Streptomyces TaxID=1883 RepID=UPI000C183A4F|nr:MULTISPECIES: hypothetical protein [unclassified Streptomyces]MBQ0866987.1 hypothetical protein [Streptomyces sp. RK75]MBQ1119871.1 hypothetical protein [Streptomyces sp. B15]MBQ1160641.1 hypothetical protein [Streptomyces sp. A73]